MMGTLQSQQRCTCRQFRAYAIPAYGQHHTCVFVSTECEIMKTGTNKVVATAKETPQNIYILNKINKVICYMGKEDKSWRWHINFDNLVKISKNRVVREIPKITKPNNTICKQCQHGKQTQVKFQTKEHSSSSFLELVHTDLCGPSKTKVFQVNNTSCYSLMTIPE